MKKSELTPVITRAISRWLSTTDKKTLLQIKETGAVAYAGRMELADRIATAIEKAERPKQAKSG
jgi:hypothetical protein